MLKATIEGVLHSDKKYDGTTLVDKYHLVSAKSDVDCTHQPGNTNENKKVYSKMIFHPKSNLGLLHA